MKRKMAGYFIFLMVSMLFIIPNGINNGLVSGATEQFEIKDTFETQINNRIYTEYDNYTQEEYFRDYKEDEAHFTEDKEGFTVSGTDNGVSDSYYEMIAVSSWNRYNSPLVNLTECPTLSFRIWCNVSYSVFYITFRDYLQNGIYDVENLGLIADTWVIINVTIPLEYLDDIRYFRLSFRSQVPFIPKLTRLDYVKLWKGNKTDYFFQSGDSVDFGEGDTDNADFSFAGEGVSANEELKITPDGTKTNTYDYFTISDIEYNHIEFSFFTDFQTTGTQDNLIFIRMHDFDNNYIQTVIYDFIDGQEYIITLSQNDYTSKTGDFDINTIKNFQIYLGSGVGVLAVNDFIYIDYISLYHDDLEDIETYQIQDTTYYRAYRGLKSYTSNIPNNYTYYEGFTANLNSSIKIDIPTLSFFPEKIQMQIYTTEFFNLTLHIGDYSDLIYSNTLFINEWVYISKSIYRYNYLINDTTDKIYFEITYETEKNTFDVFYIDELTIRYTEPPIKYEINGWYEIHPYVESSFGQNIVYNHSVNYFYLKGDFGGAGSGIPPDLNIYTVGEQTETPIFTRRIFYDKTFKSNESNNAFESNDLFIIDVDKIYNFSIHTERIQINITHSRTILELSIVNNENNDNYYYYDEIDGLVLMDYYHYDQHINIIQEDYNTLTLSVMFGNYYYSNYTQSKTIKIDLNKDFEYNNNLIAVQHFDTLKVSMYSYWDAVFPYVADYYSSWFEYKSSKSFKHSDDMEEEITPDIPTFNWDEEDNILVNIWNAIVYGISITIYSIIEFFKQSMYLRDILKGIGEFFSSVKTFFLEVGVYLDGLLTKIVELGTIGDYISNIISHISTVFDNIYTVIVDFISNTIIAIETFITDELIGFPILSDINDVIDAFISSDWGGLETAWNNLIPTITEGTLGFFLFIPNMFVGLFIGDFTVLPTLVTTFFTFMKEVSLWLTILIIMYIVYLCQMIMRRDFDRLRIEVTTIINIFRWMIDAIIFVFHWIFELIHAILDVTIPFT